MSSQTSALFSFAALAMTTLTPLPVSASQTPSYDWPTYCHEGFRSCATEVNLNHSQVQSLTVQWSVLGKNYLAQPLMANFGQGRVLIVAADDGTISSYNVDTGALVWQNTQITQMSIITPPNKTGCNATCPKIIATPVIDPNGQGKGVATLYVATAGLLFAIDPLTGRFLTGWENGIYFVDPREPLTGAQWPKVALNLDPSSQPLSTSSQPAYILISTSSWFDTTPYHAAMTVFDPMSMEVRSVYYPMSGGSDFPDLSGGGMWWGGGPAISLGTTTATVTLGIGNGQRIGTSDEIAGKGDHYLTLLLQNGFFSPVKESDVLIINRANNEDVIFDDSDVTTSVPLNYHSCPTSVVGSGKQNVVMFANKYNLSGNYFNDTALLNPAIQISPPTMALYHGWVFVATSAGSNNPGIHGLTISASDCHTPTEVWQYPLENPRNQITAVIDKTNQAMTIFVPYGGHLFALDGKTGVLIFDKILVKLPPGEQLRYVVVNSAGQVCVAGDGIICMRPTAPATNQNKTLGVTHQGPT